MNDSRHDEKAVAFFGTWTISGLYLDGWAHLHDKPETFFTPWHGVLYSGVGAAIAYFALHDFVSKRRNGGTQKIVNAGPDVLTIAGLVVFGVCAVGDFVWHAVFGIEVDLGALLSPTHLGLFTGGLLMLSFPVRAAWHRDATRDTTLGRFLPTLAGFTLLGAVTMFFLQFLDAFRFKGLFQARGGDDIWEIHAIASVFVTNAILLTIAYLAIRRWDAPFGAFTISYGVIALLSVGMYGFGLPEHIGFGVAAGLAVDILVRILRPSPDRLRSARIFSVLAPLVIWSLWFAAIQLFGDGVHWMAEVWTGTIILATLQGVGMGLLAFPPAGVREPGAVTTAP
jgi:hypothetical protein